MAWTSDDLNKIEEAIRGGFLKVKYADKEITYRSQQELMQLRDKIRDSLGLNKSRVNRIYMSSSKGTR